MKRVIGVMFKLLFIGLLIVGLHACASSVHEPGIGHEGGIVGSGNRIDCSQEQNKDKQACREARP